MEILVLEQLVWINFPVSDLIFHYPLNESQKWNWQKKKTGYSTKFEWHYQCFFHQKHGILKQLKCFHFILKGYSHESIELFMLEFWDVTIVINTSVADKHKVFGFFCSYPVSYTRYVKKKTSYEHFPFWLQPNEVIQTPFFCDAAILEKRQQAIIGRSQCEFYGNHAQ